MATDFETAIFNEYENNLFHCQKIPMGRVDGVGENVDSEYGVVVVTLNMNPRDKQRIQDMYWSMPRGTRTIAAFSSMLARLAIGKTIEEAYAITYEDVATANDMTWPDYMYWHTIAPMQAFRAALKNSKKR